MAVPAPYAARQIDLQSVLLEQILRQNKADAQQSQQDGQRRHERHNALNDLLMGMANQNAATPSMQVQPGGKINGPTPDSSQMSPSFQTLGDQESFLRDKGRFGDPNAEMGGPQTPPPPPGFVPKTQAKATPPPPPGFVPKGQVQQSPVAKGFDPSAPIFPQAEKQSAPAPQRKAGYGPTGAIIEDMGFAPQTGWRADVDKDVTTGLQNPQRIARGVVRGFENVAKLGSDIPKALTGFDPLEGVPEDKLNIVPTALSEKIPKGPETATGDVLEFGAQAATGRGMMGGPSKSAAVEVAKWFGGDALAFNKDDPRISDAIPLDLPTSRREGESEIGGRLKAAAEGAVVGTLFELGAKAIRAGAGAGKGQVARQDSSDTLAAILGEGSKRSRQAADGIVAMLRDANIGIDRINAGLKNVNQSFDSGSLGGLTLAESLEREFAKEAPNLRVTARNFLLHAGLDPNIAARQVQSTAENIRGTQADSFRKTVQDELGTQPRIEALDDVEATLKQIGDEGYRPILDQADAGPLPNADELREFLKGRPDVKLILGSEARRRGLTVEQLIDEKPYSSAHWMRSDLDAEAASAQGRDKVSLDGEVRNFDSFLDQVPGYRENKQAFAAESDVRRALGHFIRKEREPDKYVPGFGEQVTRGARKEMTTDDAARSYQGMEPRERSAADLSIRDEMLDPLRAGKMSGVELDDGQVFDVAAGRLYSLQKEQIEEALEKVLGERGKRIGDQLREFVSRRQFAADIDPRTGSNTVNKAFAVGEGPRAVSTNPLGRRFAADATATGPLLDAALATQGLPPVVTLLKHGPNFVKKAVQPSKKKQSAIAEALLKQIEDKRPPTTPPAPLGQGNVPGVPAAAPNQSLPPEALLSGTRAAQPEKASVSSVAKESAVGSAGFGMMAPDMDGDGEVSLQERALFAILGAGAVPATAKLLEGIPVKGAKGVDESGFGYRGPQPKTNPNWNGQKELRDRLGEPSTYKPWRDNPAYKNAPEPTTQTVNIGDLVPTQSQLRENFRSTQTTGEMPVIIKDKGKLYIYDGHHKIAAQAEDGVQSMQAKVIDLDGPSPRPPEQQPLRSGASPSLNGGELSGSIVGGSIGYNTPRDWNGDGEIQEWEKWATGAAGTVVGAGAGRLVRGFLPNTSASTKRAEKYAKQNEEMLDTAAANKRSFEDITDAETIRPTSGAFSPKEEKKIESIADAISARNTGDLERSIQSADFHIDYLRAHGGTVRDVEIAVEARNRIVQRARETNRALGRAGMPKIDSPEQVPPSLREEILARIANGDSYSLVGHEAGVKTSVVIRLAREKEKRPLQGGTPEVARVVDYGDEVVPETLYHGTTQKFDGYDPKRFGTGNGDRTPGVNFSTNRDQAATYGHVVREEQIKPGRQLVVDWGGRGWNQQVGKFKSTDDAARWAKKNGYDSVRFSNVENTGSGTHMEGLRGDNVIVFDTARISPSSSTPRTSAPASQPLIKKNAPAD